MDSNNYFYGVHPKVRIFAHRGLWSESENSESVEQNTLSSFLRAAQLGFSVETDIRDYAGRVCVSHDPIMSEDRTIELDEILNIDTRFALNIKCDGLIDLFSKEHSQKNLKNFFFDGSIPEMMKYSRKGFTTASRISDLEQYLLGSQIYWVDYFENSNWYLEEYATWSDDAAFIFVSPELHGHAHEKFWNAFKPIFKLNDNFGICTDYPNEFMEFING